MCFVINNYTQGFAQKAFSLPYSQFGIGEINLDGSFNNRSFAKGGVAYANGISLNLNNIASLSSLSQTAAEFTMQNRSNFFKNSTEKSFQNDISFYNFALAFPVNKYNAWAIGYLPYSTLGYKTSFYESVPNVGLAKVQYQGEGNINRAFLGTAIKFLSLHNDSILCSAGTTFNFLFGSNFQQGSVEFNPSYKLLSVSYNSQHYYQGYYFDPSIYLHKKFKKGLISLGFSYQISNSANVITNYFAQSYYLTPSQTAATKDVFLTKTDTLNYQLPTSLKAGLYFEKINGIGFSIDYQTIHLNNPEFTKPLNTLSAACQIDARKQNKNGFFNNTIYRIGAYYTQTPITIYNHQINEWGVTTSFSFPTPGKFAFNKLLIGLTAGTMGTKQNNLIKQNFIVINAGILFGDVWFKRSKID